MDSPEMSKGPRLPDPPYLITDGVWTETQWAVAFALLDAIVPSIVAKSALEDKRKQLGIPNKTYSTTLATVQSTVAEAPDAAAFKSFMEDSPSNNPRVHLTVTRTVARLPAKQRDALGSALSMLSTSSGAFLMTGYYNPVHLQPVHIREAILQSWFSSWVPMKRRLAKAFGMLSRASWLIGSPIFRQVSGYPDVPVNWKVGPEFEYKFLQFPPSTRTSDDDTTTETESDSTVIDTDIVIVGSGCGGAVAAKVLAEAGYRVIVVEKGYYFPPSSFPMPQGLALTHLAEKGVLHSLDNSTNIQAGATWGGGGTTNWSVSLQTQDYVRREWAREHGLAWFETEDYQDSMDRVCAYMGVSEEPVKQTHRGRVILDGSKKLGWAAGVCPQNSGGKEHSCGHCGLGCASAEKQGPAVSWLPDAARAGAEFIEGFMVDRVMFDWNMKATGVQGKWTSRDSTGGLGGPLDQRVTRNVFINAKRVIVAAGALLSPLLLLRSGLTNPHIGRNLHLHPVQIAGGFYKEDIRPWEGAIITSCCTQFENIDGTGHGIKIESTAMMPYTALSGIPWRSGLDFKLASLRFRHFDMFISLTRDRDSGRVYPDPVTGELVVEYTPSPYDRAHTFEGMLAICKLMYVTGAKEINACLVGLEPFMRDEGYAAAAAAAAASLGSSSPEAAFDPTFSAWLDKARSIGNAPGTAAFTSAHQMGTCRMSSDESSGVVDAKGMVWGTQGLYVADASVFPSASGVNPMVTVMAIADGVARGICGSLTKVPVIDITEPEPVASEAKTGPAETGAITDVTEPEHFASEAKTGPAETGPVIDVTEPETVASKDETEPEFVVDEGKGEGEGETGPVIGVTEPEFVVDEGESETGPVVGVTKPESAASEDQTEPVVGVTEADSVVDKGETGPVMDVTEAESVASEAETGSVIDATESDSVTTEGETGETTKG